MNLEKLKEEREKLGLSQVKIAKAVGVSRNAYSMWENGCSIPSEKNMQKLMEVLKQEV